MKIDPIKGRLGMHRFHPMLVHFPTALYPFSFVMDIFFYINGKFEFDAASRYAMIGALSFSILAMIYGSIDLIKIDPKNPAQGKALIHALLNVTWFIVYSMLFIHRSKNEDMPISAFYLIMIGSTTLGLFFSNYLGADLIIKYRVGTEK